MSDPIKAPETPNGQGQTPVQPKGTEATTSNWQPLEYQWEDGEKQSFNTKEDLLKYVREGTLRHRDYTKKTQELARQREGQTKREKEIEAMLADITAKKAKIDPMDRFLTERRDIADYIASQMRQPSPQNQEEQFKRLIEESMKPLQDKLTEAEKWQQEQQESAKRAELFAHFKGQYPDFNEEIVSQRLKELDELPDGEEDRALVELIHLAEKGRTAPTPVEVEKKAAEARAKKNGKTSPVPSTTGAPPSEELPASVAQSRDPVRAAAENWKRTHT